MESRKSENNFLLWCWFAGRGASVTCRCLFCEHIGFHPLDLAANSCEIIPAHLFSNTFERKHTALLLLLPIQSFILYIYIYISKDTCDVQWWSIGSKTYKGILGALKTQNVGYNITLITCFTQILILRKHCMHPKLHSNQLITNQRCKL